jgi:deoxycytidylate deaminase
VNIQRGLYFAKIASKFSDFPQHKIGCILVYQNYIVNNGYNCTSTHPAQQYYNKERNLIGSHISHKLHAEIKAIEGIKHFDINWKKVVVYIYREHRNGQPALAKPCAACLKLMHDMGIKRIIYSNENAIGYTIENIS